MQNLPLYYREETPSPRIAHFILSFWEFRVDTQLSSPMMHEIFPDGCISIFYHRSVSPVFQRLGVAELNLKSDFIPVNPGDIYWGMRVLPEACRLFFESDPAEITNALFEMVIKPSRFSPLPEFRFESCENFAEAVKVFENYACEFGVQNEEIDKRLAKATRIFIESKGLAKISETAREIGLSERQFERNFRFASGLSPKQFARICRFRATAVDLVKNSDGNWANRAAETGFTDQSHLNREFSNLTGNSPGGFSENVKRIEHGKILE